jgi:uncharacterized protein YjbJ (UPF0337 family)
LEATIMGLLDKLKNSLQAGKGTTKQKVGEATDNQQWQAEGKADNVKGNVKDAGEKLKDAL